MANAPPKVTLDWRETYKSVLREYMIPMDDINSINTDDNETAPPCFFYGTLMALPVLYRVIYYNPEPPEADTAHLSVRPAVLKDHRRSRVRYCDYPGVTPRTGAEVWGSLVTGLTKANMKRLAFYEGSEYTLKPIRVNVLTERTLGPSGPKGEVTYEEEVWTEMDAMTYLYTGGDFRLDDRTWDFMEYMEEHMLAWSGLRLTSNAKQIYDKRGYWKGVTVTQTKPAVSSSQVVSSSEDHEVL